QRFKQGGDVPSAWWRLFGSAPLNHLMDQAIKASPSLQAAHAALRKAQETASASYGGFFPTLSGSASNTHSKAAGSTKPLTLYNTSVSLSYVPDIFGATRRAYEGLNAAAEAKRFEVEAAYLTLTSNIATAAIQEASLRGQIKAYGAIIKAQKKQLELVKAQFKAGAVAKTNVLAQESAVAESKTSIPPLEKNLAQTRHLLAVLAGRFPSEGVGAKFTLKSFRLPQSIPVSLPSKLVEQRPDVRTALANLRAANANIGVATAAMLPQITLTGSYGVGASKMVDMFSPTTALWGLAAGLTQPLFEGGKLRHEKRASEAAFNQAAALYRQIVLSAFQDVADTLKALESDARTLKLQLASKRAATATLDLTTQQYNAGAIGYASLLTAQAGYQKSKVALVKAQAARLADTAALYQALGGGWWHQEEEKKQK
ncbi:MAG TPA: hypothetical protein DD400_05865, partial [Rhodospirillaceae bacterium]|nr:hypothetical protein [Rhodospirillaceae bacterium]